MQQIYRRTLMPKHDFNKVTFVSCYENKNIGKYEAIIAHNMLCVIFTNISQ